MDKEKKEKANKGKKGVKKRGQAGKKGQHWEKEGELPHFLWRDTEESATGALPA